MPIHEVFTDFSLRIHRTKGISNFAHRFLFYNGQKKEECHLQFRHEVKHEISNLDILILRQRLRAVMRLDRHARDGHYKIRSLYFDTPDDTALREKLDGVRIREKYRIRLYNDDLSAIHLERKRKNGYLGHKDFAVLTPEQAQAIANGDIKWMASGTDEVLLGFYTQLRSKALTAKVIVDYIREPFVFAPGNVRVTLDSDIRTGLHSTDFLNPNCAMVPVQGSPNILEVKWDGFFPDVIRDAVQLESRYRTSYSKYAACRMYD